MDPLSLSASIVALLQITSTIINYINEIRNASKEQREIAIEAGNLYGLLVRLRYRVDEAEGREHPWFAQIKALGAPRGPLDQLRESLEKLVDQAGISKPDRKRDRIVSYLQWTWNKGHALEALQSIERLKSLISLALNDDLFSLAGAIHEQVKEISTGVAAIQINSHTDALRNKILQWLRAPDPSTNYNAAIQRRHPGTGEWLLKHQTYLHWKTQSTSSFLWLSGNAGSGKTFLCSTLLENMLQFQQVNAKSIGLCYFYFDFKDLGKQNVDGLLRSLIQQMFEQSNYFTSIQNMCMVSCREGSSQPSEFMLRDLLQDMLAQFQHVYMIFDALDECTEVDSLLNLLQQLSKYSVAIVATSRRKKEIEAQLATVEARIELTNSLVHNDIDPYVRHQITSDIRFKKWGDTVQEEIISVLISKADGMFQWVYCQLEALAKCIKLSNLKRTLTTLPKTLDETYTRMIHDIEVSGHLEDAITSLRWLSFSLRPLSLMELGETLAIQTGEDSYFDIADRLPDLNDIKTICSNLVIYGKTVAANAVDNERDESSSNSNVGRIEDAPIRLAHFSVKEYLLSDRCLLRNSFIPADCHGFMAESCLLYLKHVFDLGPPNKEVVNDYSLTNYAASFWHQHAKLAQNMSTQMLDMAAEIFNNPIYLFAYSQIRGHSWRHNDMRSNFLIKATDLEHPVVYAAATGVPQLLNMLLQDDVCRNTRPEDLNSALIEAARSGTFDNVEILLKAGAEINPKNCLQDCPLGAAASAGRMEMVKQLIDAGADINLGSIMMYRNPLCAAARSERGDIVRFLLEQGANMASKCAALHYCLASPPFVKLLIAAGVEIDAKSGYSSTPLQSAINFQYLETVKLLIDSGADVNHKDDQWGSVLDTAVLSGNLEIVDLLFRAGAVAQHADDTLIAAVKKGHANLIPILLENGAKANGEPGEDSHGLALVQAPTSNNEPLVRTLLDVGADTNVVPGGGENALQMATVDSDPVLFISAPYLYEKRTRNEPDQTWICLDFCQATVVMTLTANSANEDAIVLSCLAFRKHDDTLRSDTMKLFHAQERTVATHQEVQLVQQGFTEVAAEFQKYLMKDTQDMQHSRGVTWSLARHLCDPESLLLTLCDLGASICTDRSNMVEIEFRGYDKAVPASYSLVELLLDAGANVNTAGGPYDTVLQAASRNGKKDIVELLLGRGATINEGGGTFGGPLQAACAAFSEDVDLARMILAAGANVNACGGVYGTALQAASFRGFKNVIRFLLDNGADINMKGGRYGTALQAACASPDSSVELVKLLLDAGADAEVKGGVFGSAMNAVLAKSYRVSLLPKVSDEEHNQDSD